MRMFKVRLKDLFGDDLTRIDRERLKRISVNSPDGKPIGIITRCDDEYLYGDITDESVCNEKTFTIELRGYNPVVVNL